MADISKVTLLNGTTYDLKDATARLGLPYGVCNTSNNTATKEVTINSVTELATGLTIAVKFTNYNTASNPKLKLNDFDAKAIYQYGSTAAGGSNNYTDGWPSGAIVHLTYDGSRWYYNKGYNTNTTYSLLNNGDLESGTSTTAGVVSPSVFKSGSARWGNVLNGIIAAEEIPAYRLLVGTSSGYKVTDANVTFDLKYPIVYNWEAIEEGADGKSCCTQCATRYLYKGSTLWSVNAKGSMAYLVGTVDSPGQFTINSTVFTKDPPTTEDGLYYIPLGILTTAHASYVALCPRNELWAYRNGVFRNVTVDDAATVNGHTVATDVPSNAIFTDTTYTADTSKLVTTTVPNVTSVGSAPTLGTAISADDITAWDAGSTPTLGTAIPADDITAWTTNTPTSFTVTGEKLVITPGSAASLSYTAKSIPNVTSVGSVPSLSYTSRSIPNVTSVGSAPTLGTAITVATGSLASDGGGGTVATGITAS